MPDEPQLTDATKAEQEFGRKMAQQNAASLERALKARDAENVQPEDPEAQAAVDEALQQQPDKTKPQKGDRK